MASKKRKKLAYDSHELSNAMAVRFALMELISLPAESAKRPTLMKKLRKSLLLFGSHSNDNRKGVAAVDFITQRKKRYRTEVGLSVLPSRYSLMDIVYAIESADVFAAIEKDYPRITRREFEASLRFLVLLLSAFENTLEAVE